VLKEALVQPLKPIEWNPEIDSVGTSSSDDSRGEITTH
jgi:hypothetical protein